MITIYTIAYNESILMKFMIDHYKSKFPNCHIILYDNFSTDNTVQIASNAGCEIRYFDTNNQINDNKYLEIKNNCWKDAKTDWVLVCDVDELLNISEEQLLAEDQIGTTIITSEGYNMINMEDNFDLKNIKNGMRSTQYDKTFLFNKKYITDINYMHGCHTCRPVGTKLKMSNSQYKCYHYRYLNPDYTVERYNLFNNRLSPENRKHGWGIQYTQSEEKIRAEFIGTRINSIKVID